jgi:2-(1,2-epoxy-1,2-dihydrophenyl)acetyl-CoA isomerase
LDAILVERRGNVALVRLNRPRSRNALDEDVKAGLETAIPSLMSDKEVRCLVITGSGEAFCGGGDITNMAERGAPSVRARMSRLHAWGKLLLAGEKPVVAAVNGAAAGAGFSLALLCDIVLMAESAFFRAGFPGIGAAPDLGLALTLPRAIGMARAREILLTNRRVEAVEAVAIGLAARMVTPASVVDEAVTIAADLAAGPATALGLTKLLLNQAYRPIEDFLTSETMAQTIAFGSDEFDEGVSAFLSKRRPQFT